ncbi:MAG: hypothetical protein E6I08_01650 [Chloroflexi bacterium]|nr:MAG: hypothetical protein E6I08_01650 [Chloroflexota bacterium]
MQAPTGSRAAASRASTTTPSPGSTSPSPTPASSWRNLQAAISTTAPSAPPTTPVTAPSSTKGPRTIQSVAPTRRMVCTSSARATAAALTAPPVTPAAIKARPEMTTRVVIATICISRCSVEYVAAS